jgi:hypothetical protein
MNVTFLNQRGIMKTIHNSPISRRSLLAGSAAVWTRGAKGADKYRIATFSADVTPPLGEPLLAGLYEPARKIEDPLFARGFVLLGPGQPIVLAAVDFCELRTDTYQRWKNALAKIAGTEPSRVVVCSLHQHNAPLGDEVAQKIIEEHKITSGNVCNREFHERAVQRTAEALASGLRSPRNVSHIGIGQAKVDRVASNRKAVLPNGKITFERSSTTKDADIQNAPEDLIDPYLNSLSFWDGQQPVTALSVYSVHAQTHFGKGGVTSDFTGLARARRQQETPETFQIYAAGCSGDTTVGKYNDGDPKNIPALADRLRQGMTSALKNADLRPLSRAVVRSVPLPLPINNDGPFNEAHQKKTLADRNGNFKNQSLAAMGLAWRRRSAQGYRITMPMIDFGGALLVLAPGETFVQYQLVAQQMRPDTSVITIGYGECCPGYIPTRAAVKDGWKEDAWSWSDPERSEPVMLQGLETLLKKAG